MACAQRNKYYVTIRIRHVTLSDQCQSAYTYRAVGEPRLREANKLIYGPARHKLHVLGQIEENVSHDDISSVQTVYVIKGLKANLLGLPGITALTQIVHRVNSLGSDKTTILQQYPTVFEGLGTLGDEYCIQLREGATPYSLYTPRNVPIPTRESMR